jgi:hypothetical protein
MRRMTSQILVARLTISCLIDSNCSSNASYPFVASRSAIACPHLSNKFIFLMSRAVNKRSCRNCSDLSYATFASVEWFHCSKLIDVNNSSLHLSIFHQQQGCARKHSEQFSILFFSIISEPLLRLNAVRYPPANENAHEWTYSAPHSQRRA